MTIVVVNWLVSVIIVVFWRALGEIYLMGAGFDIYESMT
jgi:hypothetical protein